MLVVKSCGSSPSPSVSSLSRHTLGVEVQQKRLAAPPVEGSVFRVEQQILIDGEKEVAISAVSPQQQEATSSVVCWQSVFLGLGLGDIGQIKKKKIFEYCFLGKIKEDNRVNKKKILYF